jgi:hypothetical protein
MPAPENSVKRSYTAIFIVRALHHLDGAIDQAQAKNYIGEVIECLEAQILAGIGLESAANDVCAELLPKKAWEGLEKVETHAKWYLASILIGNEPFDYGREPMQTVRDLQSRRNSLAHPKQFTHSDEIILQDADGTVHRNVPGDALLQEGQTLITSALALHEKKELNLAKTVALLERAIDAIIVLKERTGVDSLSFIYRARLHYQHLKQTMAERLGHA